MLKVFRDNLKSLAWVLWVVIIVLVLSLAVEFGNSTPQGAEANVAATVGDETVSVDEFRRQYQQMEQMYRQIYGEQFTPEIAQRLQLPLQALNRAVNQKILLAEAERLDLGVTDEELQSEILSIAAFKDDQGRFIGQETYQRILQQNNYTVATFEEEMRKDILLKKLEDMLRANLYVSDTEVEQAYREQVERAQIRYVQLPRSRFLQGVEIPQAEIQAYYDAHKDEFKLPAQREVAYFLVEPAKLAEQLKLTDQDLEAYYDAHKAEFTRQEQVRARHILVTVTDQRTDEQARQRIEEARTKLAGGDWAAVAKEYSDDPASKDSGGDLGVFGRGQMLPEFEQAAFNAEPGKLVGPVKTDAGYHLIEVSEKTAGGTQPLAEVKEQIRGRVAAERVQSLAETQAKEIAERLEKEGTKNAETLQAIAKEFPAATLATTPKFGEQDPVPGVGRFAPFNQAAFALKQGEVSDPIQLPRGWAVLTVQSVLEPRTAELKDVEPRVRLTVGRQKQQKMVLDRLEQARKEMAAGKTLEQVAAELGTEVKDSGEFTAQGMIQGLGLNPELAKAVMKLKPGQIGGPVGDTQGAVVFQVVERKAYDPKEFATAKTPTRERLQQEKLSRFQAALIEQRRRELGVSYDRDLLQQLGLDPEQAQPQQG
ncbi:MAG TPA: peptidyl-prolyl cis-trans isomerase [Thermoanaerobaculia bacterium]|nr:peptidyl-prolyl cis-trans isomerase [Thermoanaerobaculia bacterium]